MADPALVWSGSVDWNHGPIGPSGTYFFTHTVGTIPAGVLGAGATLWCAAVTENGPDTPFNYTFTLTLPDGVTTISVTDMIDHFGMIGAPTGALCAYAVTDPRLALGGTLTLTVRLINVLGLPTTVSDQGVGIAFLLDSDLLMFRAPNGGYGPWGNVDISPPLGDPTGTFTPGGDFGSFAPAAMVDPAPWPMLALIGRRQDLTQPMSVGYPADEPGWTTLIGASANIAAVSACLYRPISGPFNAGALWNCHSLGTTLVVARNWFLLNMVNNPKVKARSYAQIIG